MRLVKANENEERLIRNGYRRTKNMTLLTEFLNSEMVIARVDFDEDEYVNASSCSGSLAGTAKAMNMKGIAVKQSGGAVFLINESLLENNIIKVKEDEE